jgi:hypothetical protein
MGQLRCRSPASGTETFAFLVFFILGGNIFVEWKKGRGSKDHGQTRHCLLKAKDVEFNDLITFGTHVVRDPKSGACEPKPLVFSLKYSPTVRYYLKSDFILILMLFVEIHITPASACASPSSRGRFYARHKLFP